MTDPTTQERLAALKQEAAEIAPAIEQAAGRFRALQAEIAQAQRWLGSPWAFAAHIRQLVLRCEAAGRDLVAVQGRASAVVAEIVRVQPAAASAPSDGLPLADEA